MAVRKEWLLEVGTALMREFCKANALRVPDVRVQSREAFMFADRTCAYYRPQRISICPTVCAAPGVAGASWSWPGYVIDRTPFGVVQHELGHHVDWTTGERRQSYSSEYSTSIRDRSGEPKLTNYCPNDAEWFAEMFRLFVTNPDLLRGVRPRTAELLEKSFQPVVVKTWDAVLEGAPQRTLDQCERKMREARGTASSQGMLL